MMPSTIHLLETALLILVAFLTGAVLGTVARRLFAGKSAPATTIAEAPSSSPQGPQLVVAPVIAPVSRAALPAERLAAAAAGRSAALPATAPATPAPAAPSIQPARRAGQATSGKVIGLPDRRPASSVNEPAAAAANRPAPALVEAIAFAGPMEVEPDVSSTAEGAVVSEPAPVHEAIPFVPDVEPEPPPTPVLAEEVAEIDELAHVVATDPKNRVVADAADSLARLNEARAPADSSSDEVSPALEEDAEAAAMRAIEGGWTPRTAVSPKQPAPAPDLAPGEIEAAVQSARTAVASARAAAEAAVSARPEPEPSAHEHPAERHDLSFEGPAPETAVAPFLDGDVLPVPDGELLFEPDRPRGGYGRPASLSEPRGGAKDDLRKIHGITPDIEQALNRLGIFHLDQVAQWDQKATVWLDHNLALRGRIGREKWIDQARALSGQRTATPRPVRR